MSVTLAKHQAATVDSLTLQTLETLPLIAANSLVGFFRSATIEQYKYFLNMMYHYTLPSEELLSAAAAKMPTEELKAFFSHQSEEERGHYRMAREDLKQGFDENVTAETPASIQAYMHYWQSIKTGEDALAYLGAVFVFENVAKPAAQEAMNMMSRLELTKRQSTWLRVHLEADLEHGDEAHNLVKKYAETDNRGVITYGGTQACNLWVRIFQEAFLPS